MRRILQIAGILLLVVIVVAAYCAYRGISASLDAENTLQTYCRVLQALTVTISPKIVPLAVRES
jgi:CHASE3 domain sensor protein